MLNEIEIYILLFFSYSFLGWIIEVTAKFIQYKRFINRGFLIGPICPIYGYGALLISLLLKKYLSDPLAMFLFAMVICSILEYLTSYFMEKIFHARWWDYSTKKYNINGRICLDTMIPFGLLGILMMYLINPFLINIFSKFSFTLITSICSFFIVLYIVDNVLSLIGLIMIKNDIDLYDKDNTEEISLKIKNVLFNKNWKEKRIIKSFPDVKFINKNLKEKISKIEDKIEKKQIKLRLERDEKIKRLKESYDEKIKKLKIKK